MSKTPNYYIVEADALPEIFRKVVEARRMLDTGEAETVNQAVQLTGCLLYTSPSPRDRG